MTGDPILVAEKTDHPHFITSLSADSARYLFPVMGCHDYPLKESILETLYRLLKPQSRVHCTYKWRLCSKRVLTFIVIRMSMKNLSNPFPQASRPKAIRFVRIGECL